MMTALYQIRRDLLHLVDEISDRSDREEWETIVILQCQEVEEENLPLYQLESLQGVLMEIYP